MSELDEIRKRRMAELQQQAAMNADPQQLAQQQLLEQQAAQQRQAEMPERWRCHTQPRRSFRSQMRWPGKELPG